MNKLVKDSIKPYGIVKRELFDTKKLFEILESKGIKFELEFERYSFRDICVKGAEKLGIQLFSEIFDTCRKSQFSDNFLWRFIKKNFNLDLQIPILFGFWTKNAIIRPNLVVNTGLKAYSDRIGGTNAQGAMTALAIGTSGTAPTATDTTLTAETTTNGGGRAAATISNTTTTTTGDTEQWTHTWTITGTLALQEEGILDNNVSGGTLLAHNTFSTVNVANGDSFQITHQIKA